MRNTILIIAYCFIFSLAKAQIITTVAGNGTGSYCCDSTLATNAEFNQPDGIGIDAHNNLYIADRLDQRIRKIDAITGIITTIAGTGVAGFSGDGGRADTAKLHSPNYLAIDYIGNIYICDYGNLRIRKIDTFGIITTYAGTGISGGAGDGGQATNATFETIAGIATDDTGNLYISDVADAKIRKVQFATGIITTVVGTGVTGFSGDGGAAATATISGVNDIATDNLGNLYIADRGNARVRKVTANTGIISTIAGMGAGAWTGDGVPATDAPITPFSIQIDNSGNVYIADFSNERIRKVDASTGIISTFAGNGTGSFSGDGEPATNAEIHGPTHISFDNCGNLFFADTYNNRIRQVTIPQTPPTFTITTSDDSFCAGNSVTVMSDYTATVPGTAGYQWIMNGSAVSGATNSSYNYNPASGDSVRCVLTFASNCGGSVVTSNTVNMTLVSSITPTITLPTGIFYASAGTVVTVNAVLTDTPISYLIYWFNKGVWFATTTTPWVTYTKTMAIDSISAHIAPSGFCYDSAVSGVEVVIDSVLGVQSVGIGMGVRLYPNPAHDILELETSGLQSGLHQWQIMDLPGRGILWGDVKGNNTEIDIERLPVGVYVIRIDGIVYGRFVKLSEP